MRAVQKVDLPAPAGPYQASVHQGDCNGSGEMDTMTRVPNLLMAGVCCSRVRLRTLLACTAVAFAFGLCWHALLRATAFGAFFVPFCRMPPHGR